MPDRPAADTAPRAADPAAKPLSGRVSLARLRLPLLVALACFAVDRAAKIAVVEVLDLKTRLWIDVAPPWINLLMAWNEGANFGLGNSLGLWFWVGIAIAISAGLTVWATRIEGRLRRICIGALIGGALGNALDRLIYGAVADFLNMTCCGYDNPWAFNPADIFIFAGAIGLAIMTEEKARTA